MATSIAKLAILVTADTGGMQRGFAQGESYVHRFNSRVVPMNASLNNFVALSRAATGNLTGLLATAGRVGPLIALAAAFTKVGTEAIRSSEAAAQSAVKTAEAYNKMVTERGGRPADGFKRSDTLTGQAEEFSKARTSAMENEASIARRLGVEYMKVGKVLADDFRQEKDWATGANKRIAAANAQQDQMKKALAHNAEMLRIDQERQKLDAIKYRAIQAQHEAMKSRGASLTESLRTDTENYISAVKEFQNLYSLGMIGPDTVSRGIEKARKDLEAALKPAQRQMASYKGVAAADRNTMAGFSAVQAGKAELIRLAEQSKMQIAEQKKSNEELKRINEELRKPKPPVRIGKVKI